MADVYVRNGYKNRNDYLRSLAEDYCIPLDVVQTAASMMGENEDFDGIISMLEDYEAMF